MYKDVKKGLSRKSLLFLLAGVLSLSIIALFVYAAQNIDDADIIVNLNISVDGVAPISSEIVNVSKGNLILNASTTTNTTAQNMTFHIFYMHNNSEVNISSVNSTFGGSTTNQTFNITRNFSSFLSDGLYNVTANSTENAVNSSFAHKTHSFLLDTVVPGVTSITVPVTRTNFTTGNSILLNVTVNNGSSADGVNVTDIHTILFSLSNGNGSTKNYTTVATNATLFNVSAAVSDLIEGNYTATVWANDTVGNTNNSLTTTFVIDIAAPSQPSLTNISGKIVGTLHHNLSTATPQLIWNISDNNVSSQMLCNITIDSALNVSNVSSANGTNVNYTLTTSLSEGKHNWSIACLDGVRLVSPTSLLHNFTVDTIVPAVTSIVSPSVGENFTTGGTVLLNVSLNNGSTATGVNVTDIHAVFFSLDNGNGTSRNYTAASTNSTLYNFSVAVSALQDGNFTVTVYANDTAGNSNSSVTAAFLVDTAAPVTTNVNNLSITATTASVNWTTNESTNSTVSYGPTTALGSKSESSILTTQHVISLSDLSSSRTYYYNVTSCDRVKLCNITGPYTFSTAAAASSSSSSSSGGGGAGSGCGTGYSKVGTSCVKDAATAAVETTSAAEADSVESAPSTTSSSSSSGGAGEAAVEQQGEQGLPAQAGDAAADQAARDALAGREVDGGFAQTLKNLSGLWIAVVVVVVIAGVLFGVYRSKSLVKGPSRR